MASQTKRPGRRARPSQGAPSAGAEETARRGRSESPISDPGPRSTWAGLAGRAASAVSLGTRVAKGIVSLPSSSRDLIRDVIKLPQRINRPQVAAPAPGNDYPAWCNDWTPTLAERLVRAQTLAALTYRPRISVVMPVYNVERRWL